METTSFEHPVIRPAGDCGVLVKWGEGISIGTHLRVRGFLEQLERERPTAILEWIPSYTSVLLLYDLIALSADDALALAAGVAQRAGISDDRTTRTVEVPVQYGGAAGPDLDEVARLHGLSTAEVVALHSGGDYRVYLLGFSPGFPFLGGLDERIATPRLDTPRLKVPAGSIGIGGAQTGIYPVDSPGGWRLIGWTPSKIFDLNREPAFLLSVGDRVRFRAV